MLFRSGLGSLHLAHINRSEGGDQKPFGSAFWHNSARATWFLKNASTSPDGQTMTVGAFNRKSNLTKLHPAIGFELQFTGSTTTIRRINLADVEELAGQLPTWQRIAHVLEAGQGRPQTVAEIARAQPAVRRELLRIRRDVVIAARDERPAHLDLAHRFSVPRPFRPVVAGKPDVHHRHRHARARKAPKALVFRKIGRAHV